MDSLVKYYRQDSDPEINKRETGRTEDATRSGGHVGGWVMESNIQGSRQKDDSKSERKRVTRCWTKEASQDVELIFNESQTVC